MLQKKILIISFMILIVLPFVLGVGSHTASEVTAGTYPAGTFNYPSRLEVGNSMIYMLGTGGSITTPGLITANGGLVASDLTVDTDTLTVDNANNRVGIGTATPYEKLEIHATYPILFNGGGSSSLSFNAYWGTNSMWKYRTSRAAGRISFGSGGLLLSVAPTGTADNDIPSADWNNVYLTTAGLGIGTPSPDGKLDVYNADSQRVIVNPADGAIELVGSTAYADFRNDNTIDYDARLILLSNDELAVQGAQFTVDSLRFTHLLPNGVPCSNGDIIKMNSGVWSCSADSSGSGDITSVTAGTALTGGGTSGDVTLNVNTASVASSIAGNGLGYSAPNLVVNTGDGIDIVSDAMAVDVTDILGTGLIEDAVNNILVYGLAALDGSPTNALRIDNNGNTIITGTISDSDSTAVTVAENLAVTGTEIALGNNGAKIIEEDGSITIQLG